MERRIKTSYKLSLKSFFAVAGTQFWLYYNGTKCDYGVIQYDHVSIQPFLVTASHKLFLLHTFWIKSPKQLHCRWAGRPIYPSNIEAANYP